MQSVIFFISDIHKPASLHGSKAAVLV